MRPCSRLALRLTACSLLSLGLAAPMLAQADAAFDVPAPHPRLLAAAQGYSDPAPAAEPVPAVATISQPAAEPFLPVAPSVPVAPYVGQTPCDYYAKGGDVCGAPVAQPSAEVQFVKSHSYAVAQPQVKVVTRIVEKPVIKVVERPVIHLVEKKTRPFADFWSYIGMGLSYRTVTIPGAHEATKYNFLTSDLRAGVMYQKYFGVEGRLGLSTGTSGAQDYDCGYGYYCPLTVKAPLTAAVYARASLPIGPGQRILPYALVGAAFKRYQTALDTGHYVQNEAFSRWDLSYGAGVEFMVSKALAVGAEFVNNGHDDRQFGIQARYIF